ncbi:MAG: class I SAM-dependent methyltransferase [Patescibacteria group bacterium]|jgi:SAM-dependent methyltransferase
MIKRYYYYIKINFLSILDYIFGEWRRLGIKPKEIVVDLGCGGRPLPRADIIVDKFLTGFTERPTDFIDNKAFIIQCDIDHLPFKNKSIDFVYSSHVIEHLNNPAICLNEMERIGKRGYITCPSALREQIMALKMHLWFAEIKDNKIILFRKKQPYPEFINNYFDKFLASEQSYIWHSFERSFRKEFFINYFWKNKINYVIHDLQNIQTWKIAGETEFQPEKNFLLSIRKSIIIFTSQTIKKIFSKQIDIEKILCCPNCHGNIKINDEFVFCEKCNEKYQHQDKRIFYFVQKYDA